TNERTTPPPSSFFFFNQSPTTDIYTLSLHDALPIWYLRTARAPCCRKRRSTSAHANRSRVFTRGSGMPPTRLRKRSSWRGKSSRSEEHTSELQSRGHLVCRLLLEKKKRQ